MTDHRTTSNNLTPPQKVSARWRHIVEAGVNTGNLDVFKAFLTEDYARHSQATTEMPEIRGVEQMLVFLREQFAMFPDPPV